MNYPAEPLAIIIFLFFVVFVLWISYWFSRRAQTASGYYAAGGKIHWSVNGVAFAGDYLSAASFLGIAGMIALYGYDGFLYSIGFLAGWMVALFVVAEPLKRMGKYTFASAIDAKFKSRGVVFAAALSTLVVSLFYLIPQMVGAGAIITPLVGLPFEAGVLIVGGVVILIVVTAGRASTTWVQFIKGSMLVVFTLVLTVMILVSGFSTKPGEAGNPLHDLQTLELINAAPGSLELADSSYNLVDEYTVNNLTFARVEKDGLVNYWKLESADGVLTQAQSIVSRSGQPDLYNGAPKEEGLFFQVGHLSMIDGETNVQTGPVNILSFFGVIKESEVIRWGQQRIREGEVQATVYYQIPTQGSEILVPGQNFKIDPAKGATTADRINFVSLMLSLFLGTAALPHILIRYYTVPNPAFARKSTIVAVAAIGFFYVMTFFIGLGAMTQGGVDVTNQNMSAPLLVRTFGVGIFALISATAFGAILSTVSGLIVASSGAVAIDLVNKVMRVNLSDHSKVVIGRLTAISVGIIAMALGLAFKNMNVSFLVGWAFTIAASANLPAIIMILFWKKVTAKGVIASIAVGLAGSLLIILLSPETFSQVYNLPASSAPMPISQPAIITVPLSFLTLVIVSLLTNKKNAVESR